jgi:serine/threonine protein kinase
MEDLIGHYFGGYKLARKIGNGGMAQIYQAFDEKLSRPVAIKLIPLQADINIDAPEVILARFRQEAQAIGRLRHPNILTIYDYGEAEEWAYLVMEYVPGGSLAERLKPNQSFDYRRTLEIIIAVADALAFAHEQGVIHRDVKPANILLAEEDWPLLADFGLAKLQRSVMFNLTTPGQVMGTIAYAAPEQIQGSKIDSRVDIYALGVVLYQLLSGKLPFYGESAFDLMMTRMTERPIPLLEANPTVPVIFEAVINKALAQKPEQRYASMAELVDELTKIQETLFAAERPQGETLARRDENFGVNQHQDQGGQGSIRLKVSGTGQDILIPDQAGLIIGRAHKEFKPDVDLEPYGGSQAGVSRRHSRLFRQGDDWFVEDLGSTNGTFVNGVRLVPQQTVKLKDGDIIRCGQLELKFGLEEVTQEVRV